MITTQRGLRMLLATSLLGFAAGCGGGNSAPEAAPGAPATPGAATKVAGKGPRLRFISNSNSDWWSAVEQGMIDGGKEFGAQVELTRNNGQPEGQIHLIEEAISQPDIKGVAVSVLEADSPGIRDKMLDLQKAGKIVITVDSDSANPDARRAYIGTNNRKAGEVAGKAAAQLRPKGGKTAVFVGTAVAANARERKEGFFAGAGPAFKTDDGLLFQDGGDLNIAQRNVGTAITKNPDIGVFLGLWSYNAPRIAEEVGKFPELRKQVTVVTFDLDQQAVDHIASGRIDASVCQNPYEMGYRGVRLLKALVEDDKATISDMLPDGATTIDTGVRIIVPSADSPVKGDNVIDIKAMKEWLSSKGLKSS